MGALFWLNNADNKGIEQVNAFKHLGMLMHGTKGLSPAIDLLCKAARRAMFGLQCQCQQLSIHDPVFPLKRKLFDTLVRPILCYCCEFWYVLGGKAALDDLERIEISCLKVLHGVHTKTLHVLAEFGRYSLHVTWQLQAANYLSRLERMPPRKILRQAFNAYCRLPGKVSWHAKLGELLHEF